jgi:hypothetical protein
VTVDDELRLQNSGATTFGAKAYGTTFRAKLGALGFFGAAPVGKPAVTGSRASAAALTSLLSALSTLGLINDLTTA